MNIKKIPKIFWHSCKNIFQVFLRATTDFIKNDGIEHSGYIAFLSMLSFFPFVIFFTFILGLIGQTAIGIYSTKLILSSLPTDMSAIINPIIQEITSNPSFSVLSIAFLSIIWTASSFVEGLRTILNKIYRVENKPHYILRRILSILEFFMITFVIISAVFGLIILPQIIQKINSILVGSVYSTPILWIKIRGFATYSILFFMISLIYYLIPNKKQKIDFIFPGAFITLTGWVISGKLFTLYLKNFNQFNIIYGSLGGVVITLIFFYIISAILVYGAEFNYYFGERFLKKFVRRINVFQK